MATFLARAVALDEVPERIPRLDIDPDTLADAEAYMVGLVNDLCKGLNRAPLEQFDGIATVARRWSNTMLEHDDFKHNPRFSTEYPGGSVISGENIAKVSYHGDLTDAVRRAFDGFSDSPGHYRNMTNPAYGQIGVGIAVGLGYVWLTQNFACYPSPGSSSCD